MVDKSDNIFELGLLYQCIMALKKVRDEIQNHDKSLVKDLDKIIAKIKTTLKNEVDKI